MLEDFEEALAIIHGQFQVPYPDHLPTDMVYFNLPTASASGTLSLQTLHKAEGNPMMELR